MGEEKRIFRKISQEELENFLKLHRQWLESEGKEGLRASLCGADLRTAIFGGADLSDADISGSDLSGSNLYYIANFSGANFRGVDFSGSDLSDADLRWVSLDRANLTMAKLCRANLSRANLVGVNLNNCSAPQSMTVSPDYMSIRYPDYLAGLHRADMA